MSEKKSNEDWFAKRIILSAGAYLGNNEAARVRVQAWRRKNGKSKDDIPATHAELREALVIKSDRVWLAFLVEFVNARSVLRRRGPYSWSEATVDERADQNAMQRAQQNLSQEQETPPMQGEEAIRNSFQQGEQAISQEQLNEVAKQIEKMEGAVQTMKRDFEVKLNDEKAIVEQLRKDLADAKSNKVTVITIDDLPNKKRVDLGLSHKTMPELIIRLRAEQNTYLVGPAGSGKTTGAEQAATALSLQFGFMSVGPQTTKTDILGYMSATGSYVSTEFRKRYEHGGVFLFDEIDAGNGGVLTCINAALAGSGAAFPDAMVKRHPEFRCIAAGNTYGTGPDRVYVGRQELDGASLDRFNFLEWGYDEALEMAIASQIDEAIAAKWVRFVQAARKAVGTLSIRHVISPRASFGGVKLMIAGADWASAEATSLWKSMKPADISRAKAEMTRQGYVLNA